jgi:cell division protein FtsW
MKSAKKIDRVLLIVVGLLVFGGFIVFLSASLGLTAKNSATYSSVVFNQLFFGLILGGITAFVVSRVDFTFWKKVSLYLFIIAIILTLLVFVPNFGFESGGAKRWLSLGPLSFQPAEFLKVAFVLYFATWLSGVKDYVQKFKFGLLPLIIILSIVGVVLLNQPDTSTFIMIVVAGFSMIFVKLLHSMIP